MNTALVLPKERINLRSRPPVFFVFFLNFNSFIYRFTIKINPWIKIAIYKKKANQSQLCYIKNMTYNVKKEKKIKKNTYV